VPCGSFVADVGEGRVSPAPDAASISVVVPTYNDVAHIGEALRSIVSQTALPGEIVVSDDGSDDGTEQFVRSFAERHADSVPVRYTRRPSQGGDAAARNSGIAAAHGDWIAICDSDDTWAANKLERQLDFIGNWSGSRPIVLLGTHGYNTNDAGRVISTAAMGPTSEEAYDAVRHRGGLFFVIHSSVLYARAEVEALGGYSTAEYGPANEFDLFCRMAERGIVMSLPEPLVYYRKRAGSMQLDLFWDRHRNVQRLAENQRRRVNGEATLSAAEFSAQLAAAPWWSRVRRRRHAWGMFYYRAGATDMVNGRRLRGSLELALASILDTTRLRAGVGNAFRARRGGGSRTPPAQSLDLEPIP
jgi:glycosyltransferase involved in cell wall biosynthesis